MAFMLPTPDEPIDERAGTAASSEATEGSTEGPAEAPKGKGHRPLEPIGPEKLRQLRQSILNGTYPLDEAVVGGLAKMFLGPKGRQDRSGQ